MDYFNYTHIAEEAGIPKSQMCELREMVRRDFPKDDMLFDLHMLRACMAVRDGLISLDDLCKPETTVQPA